MKFEDIESIEIGIKNEESNKLNAGEALFGFTSWLTTQKLPCNFVGSQNDCYKLITMLIHFMLVNGIEEPRDASWTNKLNKLCTAKQLGIDGSSCLASKIELDNWIEAYEALYASFKLQQSWSLHLSKQIEELATFIMENFDGEPSQSEGAIQTAIRLLSKYRIK